VAYEPPPTDPTFRRYPLATMHETMSLQRMREDPLARTACTLAGRLLMAMRTYDDLVCVRCEGTITRGLQMRATLLHLHSDEVDSVGFACGDEFSPCLCCGRVLGRGLLGPTARAVIGVPQDPEGTGYGALVCVGCAPVSHADLLRHFEIFVATAFVEGGHA
jgi:hypothetical protein